ncbi:Uncharacterised protein [Sphingobacterium multivorum]|nr:Uncharacterised protein [Sphingobacterium multivorum]
MIGIISFFDWVAMPLIPSVFGLKIIRIAKHLMSLFVLNVLAPINTISNVLAGYIAQPLF